MIFTFEDLERIAKEYGEDPVRVPSRIEWIGFAWAIREYLSQNEHRPCSIKNKTGYTFLRWVVEESLPAGACHWDYKGKFDRRTYGLVEDPYGNVIKVRPEKIRFEEKHNE